MAEAEAVIAVLRTRNVELEESGQRLLERVGLLQEQAASWQAQVICALCATCYTHVLCMFYICYVCVMYIYLVCILYISAVGARAADSCRAST